MTIQRTVHNISYDTQVALTPEAFTVTTPWHGARRYAYPATARQADDFVFEFRFNVYLDDRSLDWLAAELRRRARS
jgi:hypothetical protein